MESIKKNVENLRKLIEKIAKENDYNNPHIDVQAISSGGANYSSELYVCTISAPPKEDLKLFAKVACVGEELRNSIETFSLCFAMECVFYSKLAVTFDELYNKHGVEEKDRLRIPRYYGHDSTQNKETLVLENLVVKGFESFDRMKTFDWNYASAAITELAKFHALGIACTEENLEELHKMETLDMFTNNQFIDVFKKQAIKNGTEAVKEEYRSKLIKHFENHDFGKELKLLWAKTDDGFFIHGDYRPSNLMHRSINGKLEVLPIDYQTCHMGSLVVDLLYFIWSGSDSQFREQYYQQSLDHYYTELTLALKDLHINIDEIYPRTAYEQELDECKTLGLFLGLGFMSILTVEPENAPKMDKVEDMMLGPNQLALDRMNGVVADYVRWGII